MKYGNDFPPLLCLSSDRAAENFLLFVKGLRFQNSKLGQGQLVAQAGPPEIQLTFLQLTPDPESCMLIMKREALGLLSKPPLPSSLLPPAALALS